MVSRSTRDYQEGQVELSPTCTRSQPGSVPTWGAQAPRARVQPQPPAGPSAAPGQGTQEEECGTWEGAEGIEPGGSRQSGAR